MPTVTQPRKNSFGSPAINSADSATDSNVLNASSYLPSTVRILPLVLLNIQSPDQSASDLSQVVRAFLYWFLASRGWPSHEEDGFSLQQYAVAPPLPSCAKALPMLLPQAYPEQALFEVVFCGSGLRNEQLAVMQLPLGQMAVFDTLPSLLVFVSLRLRHA